VDGCRCRCGSASEHDLGKEIGHDAICPQVDEACRSPSRPRRTQELDESRIVYGEHVGIIVRGRGNGSVRW
jgi:hypothetical protein